MSRLVRYPGATAQADVDGSPTTDGYLGKLAKYVPAEVLSVVSIVLAAFSPTGTALAVAVMVAAVVNVGYLWTLSRLAKGEPPPKWYFYALSALAFGCWAVAILDPVAALINIGGVDNAPKRAAVLAGAAFLIPLVDTFIGILSKPRRAR